MNRGDTLYIILDYTVDDAPIAEGDFDEIEFSIGNKQYTLTGGDIEWDSDLDKYCLFVDQDDTFAFSNPKTTYQIRLKKGKEVVSDNIKPFIIGKTISNKTL